MVTLTVCEEVIQKLSKTFLSSRQEKGFLLGCRTRLDCVDCSEQIPAIQAGLHFYKPDAICADQIIRQWASQNICFCGFIHSHVVDKETLSEADVIFARQLFQAYRLPVLWFGLALVNHEKVSYQFYGITDDSISKIKIKEIIA